MGLAEWYLFSLTRMVLTFSDLAVWRFVVFSTVPISLLDTKDFWCLDLKQLDQYLVVMVDSGCGGLGRIELVGRNWLSFSCVNSLTGMDAYMRPFFDELH